MSRTLLTSGASRGIGRVVAPEAMTQSDDLAALVSTLLMLPKAVVPFELAVNGPLKT
ncbi:hypothetical protein [Cyanobium sp. ATX 6F1]|uniref:hypothetical protein n=1 Tax=unclassified Cyanobium TaxID=2627006 RepID=UPI0020CDA85C|nr:hypothetical protein [Cyanobium sp. ATX 6F1]MCP9914898.1 hypothetical protein [Cyanobium sp. ATX 6F1]